MFCWATEVLCSQLTIFGQVKHLNSYDWINLTIAAKYIWGKHVLHVWKYLRVSKWWWNFHFWVNYPFKKGTAVTITNEGKYSGCVSNRSVEDTLNPQTSVKTQLRYSYFLFSGFDCWYKILLLKPICFSLVFLALTFFCLNLEPTGNTLLKKTIEAQ